MLSTEELATFIKFFRELWHCSQEQLGEISGLSVRPIQRIETGEASSPESGRALARAFEFEDIDALNKSFLIPSPKELAAEKEKFDREHVTLTALPLAVQVGRLLVQIDPYQCCALPDGFLNENTLQRNRL